MYQIKRLNKDEYELSQVLEPGYVEILKNSTDLDSAKEYVIANLENDLDQFDGCKIYENYYRFGGDDEYLYTISETMMKSRDALREVLNIPNVSVLDYLDTQEVK